MVVNRHLFLIILSVLFIPLNTVVSADSNSTIHITYVCFVDPVLGFYKVLDETTHQPSNFVDHILTINQGDTIIWKNDADSPNTAIAIVSEQNLFPDAVLNTNTAVFPYVFDQGGKYTFHVGEHTTSVLTIMVRAANTPIPTPTSVPTENTPLTLVNSDPQDNTVNNSINETRTFSITVNKPADMVWNVDNKEVQFNQSVSTSNYVANTAITGMSIVDVTAKAVDGTVSREWNWIVGAPVTTEDTPTPTPAVNTVHTAISDSQTKQYSSIQIMGMIIIVLSIYITYRTGKDKK